MSPDTTTALFAAAASAALVAASVASLVATATCVATGSVPAVAEVTALDPTIDDGDEELITPEVPGDAAPITWPSYSERPLAANARFVPTLLPICSGNEDTRSLI